MDSECKIELGDLVEDKEYPGSQGMVTCLMGYDYGTGLDHPACTVHWIFHRGNNGQLASWKMWKCELKLLAKAKKNV